MPAARAYIQEHPEIFGLYVDDPASPTTLFGYPIPLAVPDR